MKSAHDLVLAAKRELAEETGVEHAQLVDCGIYSLEVLTVDGHVKRGSYVGSHLHLNVTYLAWQTPPSRFASNRTRTAE